MPKILALSLSPRHGFSKQPQTSLTLIANAGIEGDAHCGATTQHLYLKRKDPTLPNLCQVHLLASELLAELAPLNIPLAPGDLGENILTSGIDLLALPTHTLLTFGPDANTGPILKVTGLRTPCSQIDDFRPGLQQHLWGPPVPGSKKKTRRAGIMSIVLRGGILHPHDPLYITLPAEPHIPLGPV
jgi:MOSC domain-containing protein YiiM